MFAKVFKQIFDSSLAEDPHVRHLFMDLLVLADADGVVDMTIGAIAGRTRLPREDVARWISALERPDPESRTPDLEGRRLVRLDEHRAWGWRIVNYRRYRESATREMLRMGERERKAAWRQSKLHSARKSPFPTPLSLKDKETEEEEEPSRVGPGPVPDMSGTNEPVEPSDGTAETHLSEPPLGFPKTPIAAAAHADFVGCPRQFAEETWALAASRGWRDSKGLLIQSWRHHLGFSWACHRGREAEKAAKAGTLHPDGRPRSITHETLDETEKALRRLGV